MQKTAGIVTRVLATSLLVIAARPAAASLLAYYPFDGNLNDISGNNYNGTVSGTAAYTSGVFGQAFSFNGSTFIGTTTADNLGLVNHSFTVDTYVNFSSLAGDQPVVATAQFGLNQGLHLLARNGTAYMGFFGNDTGGLERLAINTWYNIAWVYDNVAQTQTIYINGVLDAQTAGHSPFQGTGETVQIGAGFDGVISGGAAVDNLQIYDTALTQSQIQGLMAPEPSELAVGVLAFVAMLAVRAASSRFGGVFGTRAGRRL